MVKKAREYSKPCLIYADYYYYKEDSNNTIWWVVGIGGFVVVATIATILIVKAKRK